MVQISIDLSRPRNRTVLEDDFVVAVSISFLDQITYHGIGIRLRQRRRHWHPPVGERSLAEERRSGRHRGRGAAGHRRGAPARRERAAERRRHMTGHLKTFRCYYLSNDHGPMLVTASLYTLNTLLENVIVYAARFCGVAYVAPFLSVIIQSLLSY